MISGKPDFAEAAALSIDSLESGDYRERALELNSYINRYPLGMFNVAYLALQDVEATPNTSPSTWTRRAPKAS